MAKLRFQPGYAKEPSRLSFVFYATNGNQRFPCYVGNEQVADLYELSGGDEERFFDLTEAHKCAQTSYDEHGLEEDGSLLVELQR